jgi:hypothetical protein
MVLNASLLKRVFTFRACFHSSPGTFRIIIVKMVSMEHAQNNDAIGQEPKRVMSNADLDEEEAVRKVEAANTPDLNAQSGVRNVEAVTLTWTKTSLACAFVW